IGNYAAAKLHYGAARKLAPKDVRALSGLAMSEMQDALPLNDPKQRDTELRQAETHFQQALALNPDDAPARNGLGYLYERESPFYYASGHYRKRLNHEPDNPEVYRQIARVYTMQRQPDKVLETWRAYRARRPGDPTSYAEAAGILEAQAKWAEALAEWKLLLARNPKKGEAMILAGGNPTGSERQQGAAAHIKH